MADTERITLDVALSSDFQKGVKAARDEAKGLGDEIKNAEKKLDAFQKMGEIATQRELAGIKGDTKAVAKLTAQYDSLAVKAGVAGKSMADITAEARELTRSVKQMKADRSSILGRPDDLARTAESIARLRSATAINPALEPRLKAAEARFKSLGGSLEAVNASTAESGGRMAELKTAVSGMKTSMLSALPGVGAVAAAFKKVPVPILAAVGAVGGLAVGLKKAKAAMHEYALETISSGDSIAKESAALGISGESFQRLAYAMRRGGASTAGFSTAIKTLDQQLNAAQNGAAESIKTFKTFGVSMSDIKTKKPEEIFLQIADALQKIEDPVQRARAGAKLFGGEGYRLTAAMAVGSRGLIELGDEAERLGLVMSSETLAAMEDGADAMENASAAAQGFRQKLGAAAAPGVIRRQRALAKAFEDNRETIGLLAKAGGKFAGLCDDVLVGAINGVSAAIQIWRLGSENLGNWIFKFNTEILPALGDKLVAFWGFLVDKLSTFWGFLKKKFMDAVDFVKDVWSGFTSWLTESVSMTLAFFEVIPEHLGVLGKKAINFFAESFTDGVNDFLRRAEDLPLVGRYLEGKAFEPIRFETGPEMTLADRAIARYASERDARQVNVYNTIDARGAAPGAAVAVSRAVNMSTASTTSALYSAEF